MVNPNPLYPAFFRLDRLQLLVVGAGQVGEEKLRFILKSSPNARVTIVAPWMGEELRAVLDNYNKGAGPQVQTNSEHRRSRCAVKVNNAEPTRLVPYRKSEWRKVNMIDYIDKI